MTKYNHPFSPFEHEECDHDKATTDPEGIGLCMECFAMNIALSETPLDMDEVEATYMVMAGIQGFFGEMDDDE